MESNRISNIKDIESLDEKNVMYIYEDDDGYGCFYYKTNNGYEVYYYNHILDFANIFPEINKALNNLIWNEERTSYIGYDGKYKFIYVGHGAFLAIDKYIYDDYVNYYKNKNKEDCNGFVDAYDTFEEMCIDNMNEKEDK
jgi:hypothetical protein